MPPPCSSARGSPPLEPGPAIRSRYSSMPCSGMLETEGLRVAPGRFAKTTAAKPRNHWHGSRRRLQGFSPTRPEGRCPPRGTSSSRSPRFSFCPPDRGIHQQGPSARARLPEKVWRLSVECDDHAQQALDRPSPSCSALRRSSSPAAGDGSTKFTGEAARQACICTGDCGSQPSGDDLKKTSAARAI